MAMSFGGVRVAARPPPTEEAAKVFEKISAHYEIDPKVTKRMVDVMKLKTIHDFVYLDATTFTKVIIDPLDLKEMAPINEARLRMAHEDLSAGVKAMNTLDLSETNDLDVMICPSDLNSLKNTFYARHKITYEPQVDAPDKLVSRIYKEINKRELTVRDLWSIQSLAARQRNIKKKSEIVPGLTWDEEDDEYQGTKNGATYLAQMEVYLLGLAKAGCTPIEGVEKKEEFGTNPADFVVVPLCTTMRYLSSQGQGGSQV